MGLTDYSRMDKEFFESGVRAERERIIKLLQKEVDFMQSGIGLVEYHLQTISFLEGFIALIKGENK